MFLSVHAWGIYRETSSSTGWKRSPEEGRGANVREPEEERQGGVHGAGTTSEGAPKTGYHPWEWPTSRTPGPTIRIVKGKAEEYPLDVLGAQTEGMLGYAIQQELGNLLPTESSLGTILTMVEVDPDDPAFENPTKPIGPIYSEG
ncbi:MAG: hypothetical protein Ct9H90mP24_5260 [Methanobacteriota archaeon]|nr:MAG: hypothetical protein Ct9H90mP24_5260 [Euryarchaeota archaeon]